MTLSRISGLFLSSIIMLTLVGCGSSGGGGTTTGGGGGEQVADFGTKEFHPTLGDMDLDGDLDLFCSGSWDVSMQPTRHLNNGSGTFLAGTSFANSVTLGSNSLFDFDNDGDLDFAYQGFSSPTYYTDVFANGGGDVFTDLGLSLTGLRNPVVRTGDLNSDGLLDLLISGEASGGGTTKCYLNDGSGGFNEKAYTWATPQGRAAALGDFDNDGDLDVFAMGNQVRLYWNDGAANFIDMGQLIGRPEHGNVALGDFDNDGDLDMLVCGNTTIRAQLLYNEGSGVMRPHGMPTLPVSDKGQCAFYDHNNDGNLDFILCGVDSGTAYTVLYINDGAGVDGAATFTEITSPFTAVSHATIAVGDIDKDGDSDVIINGRPNGGGGAQTQTYVNETAAVNDRPTQPTTMNSSFTGTGPYEITFSWNDGSDPETGTKGLSYELRIGTSSGSHDIRCGYHLADGTRTIARRGSLQPKKAGLSETKVNLPAGTYYWTIQTVDTSYIGSTVTNEQTLTVP